MGRVRRVRASKRHRTRGLTVRVSHGQSAPRRERRPWQTQALEDRRWLHDNPPAGQRVAPQSVRGCRRHPV